MKVKVLLSALCLVVLASVSAYAEDRPLSGFIWSDNVGWTSASSQSDGSSINYGVIAEEVTANNYLLKGYAWSDNVGWLKFNTGTPSTADAPNPGSDLVPAQIRGGSLVGWARFCAGTVNGDCVSATRSDGWDGWVKFTNATVNQSTGEISGWAWGDVVGWLDLDLSIDADCPEDDPDCEPEEETVSIGCYMGQNNNIATWRARCRDEDGDVVPCPDGTTFTWNTIAGYADADSPSNDDEFQVTMTVGRPGPFAPTLVSASGGYTSVAPSCPTARYIAPPVQGDVMLEMAPEVSSDVFGAWNSEQILVKRGFAASARLETSANVNATLCQFEEVDGDILGVNDDGEIAEIATWNTGNHIVQASCPLMSGVGRAESNSVTVNVINNPIYIEF